MDNREEELQPIPKRNIANDIGAAAVTPELLRDRDRILRQAAGSNFTLRTIARGEAVRAHLDLLRSDTHFDRWMLNLSWAENHRNGAFWTAALKYMNDHKKDAIVVDGKGYSRGDVARKAIHYTNAAIETRRREQAYWRSRGYGSTADIKAGTDRAKAIAADNRAVTNYRASLAKAAGGNPDRMMALIKREVEKSGVPSYIAKSDRYPVGQEKDGITGNINKAAYWAAELHQMTVKGETARDFGGKTLTKEEVAKNAMSYANAGVAAGMLRHAGLVRAASPAPKPANEERIVHTSQGDGARHEGLEAMLRGGAASVVRKTKDAVRSALSDPVKLIPVVGPVMTIGESAAELFNRNIGQDDEPSQSRGIGR